LKERRDYGMSRVVLSGMILLGILGLTLLGLRPPAPKPTTAPPAVFSAERALDTLHRILGLDRPHPVGSPADDEIRARILDEFDRLGYLPQVQTSFACAEWSNCATVNNVLARLDGAEPGPAVLLAAHYDSVPAGPSVSDDGVGVAAVLEVARALKVRPAPRHSVIFLLDDGEEAGLLGSRAFVDSHPWAKDVRAAVNLEARGTAGPSLLFETGSANDWAIRLFAEHAARPAATSIAYSVYKRLPNDTDFTVFRAAGYQGVNFAFIGGVARYHTPLDNSANVSAASIQHHGENALAALLAFADADLTDPPAHEAVYFDVFGRWLARWPARRSLPIALAATLLLALQVGWLMWSKRVTSRQVLWGMIGWIVTLAVTGIAALLVARLLHALGATPVNWIAHPFPLKVAFWSLALAVIMALGLTFARSASFWGLWAGAWAWWALLAIVFAAESPGLSYPFVVPLCFAASAGLPATVPRRALTASSAVAVILPSAAAAVIGFTPAVLLYDGLGVHAIVLISVLVALILTPLAPLCAELRASPGLRSLALPWVPILATVIALFATVVVPAYSAKSPERLNITYWQDADTGESQWYVAPESRRLPEPMRVAASFGSAVRGPSAWDDGPEFAADAPHLDLAAPTFTILDSTESGGLRSYRTLLRSERGAPTAALTFPPDSGALSVRIEGQPLLSGSAGEKGLVRIGAGVYRCVTMPPAGVEVTFSLPIGKPVKVSVADESYGLPPEGAFLANSRPLKATPSQDGDVTIVSRHVELIP